VRFRTPLAIAATFWSATLFASPIRIHSSTRRHVQMGVASWYGAKFRGRPTASGIPFDDRRLTAAHRTLPLGTRVKVTNLKNGRSVIVKINDRGPVPRRRLIDLSRAAAERLGFKRRGLAPVAVSVLDTPGADLAGE
jgi:peptidoglycan lytic transglycosylase